MNNTTSFESRFNNLDINLRYSISNILGKEFSVCHFLWSNDIIVSSKLENSLKNALFGKLHNSNTGDR